MYGVKRGILRREALSESVIGPGNVCECGTSGFERLAVTEGDTYWRVAARLI